MSHTLQRLREAIPAAHDVGERRDLLARFAALCDAVDAVLAAPDAPSVSARKRPPSPRSSNPRENDSVPFFGNRRIS